MRVKLSYTVEEENVLKESAKILNLSAEDLQEAINLFTQIQNELIDTQEGGPNAEKALEKMEKLRKALLSLDTRLLEVSDIVEAYEDYRRGLRRSREEGPSEPSEQNELVNNSVGTD